MSNIKTDAVAAVATKVGNGSAAGYLLAWLTDFFGNLGLQEWVAIVVGASAVASYLTAAYLNLKKAREIGSEQEE